MSDKTIRPTDIKEACGRMAVAASRIEMPEIQAAMRAVLDAFGNLAHVGKVLETRAAVERHEMLASRARAELAELTGCESA